MQIGVSSNSPKYAAGSIREREYKSKVLLRGTSGTLENYRFDLAVRDESAEEWETPRHRHNFDQIRYNLAGDWTYAKGKSLPPGWVGYFPESVFYGPQVVRPGNALALLQFSGASRSGYLSEDERHAGYLKLAAKGRFEKMAYVYEDDSGKRHKQEAYEAVWECVKGQKLEYPKPRYEGIVIMNPDAFVWRKTETDGMAIKRLGSFTERDVQIEFVHLDRNVTYTGGLFDGHEVLFLASGNLTHGADSYGTRTGFGFSPSEGESKLAATEESELLRIRMPRFQTV